MSPGTDRQIRAGIQFQWARVKDGGSGTGELVVGCLVGFFQLMADIVAEKRHGQGTEQGQDKVFTLPLPACESCDPQLADPGRLKDALRRIPEYAALLDRYPNARVTRRP